MIHSRHFILIGTVPIIIKVQTAKYIDSSFCIRIPLHHCLKSFSQYLAIPERKIIFPFIAEGSGFINQTFITIPPEYLPQLNHPPICKNIWCHLLCLHQLNHSQTQFASFQTHFLQSLAQNIVPAEECLFPFLEF